MDTRSGHGDGAKAGTARDAAGLGLSALLTVSDQTDEHGRLLLEDAAPQPAIDAAVGAGIAMELITSPHDDPPSRRGALVNASAYEALRHDTGEVLRGLAWMAQRHGQLAPSQRGTVDALAEVSRLGITLPLVLFNRAHEPVPPYGALPTYVASIFKASRGVFSASFDMRSGDERVSGPVTAEDVVAFADRRGHLRREATDRACAAPTKLITRTIDVILSRETADAETSQLSQVLAFEQLWQFRQLEHTFSRALSKYGAVLERAAGGRRVRRPRELFKQKVWMGTQQWSFGELTEQFLEVAHACQADLNQLLGRADAGPEITFDDVLEML